MLFFQDQTPLSSNPPMGNNPIAETRERCPKPCQRKCKKSSRKFLPGCKEGPEIRSETLIISRTSLDPSAKNFLRMSGPHLNPSLAWMFIM
jgi:hypothetical protein